MTIAEKYGIPPEAVKRLIDDGLMNCSARKYEAVMTVYEKNLAEGIPKMQAVLIAAEAEKLSERQVYRIIKEFH